MIEPIEDGDFRGIKNGLRCEFPGCGTELKGNPNDKQCNQCCKVYCSKHQRMVEDDSQRMCVRCKPRVGRRRRRFAAR